MKTTNTTLFFVLSILFLTGCSTLQGTKNSATKMQAQAIHNPLAAPAQIIAQGKAEALATAVASWNRELLDSLITDNETSDPVLLVAEGNFLLREGNAEDAGKLFMEALSIVNDNHYLCSPKYVRLQPNPDRNKNGGGEAVLSEDKLIIQAVRESYLQRISNTEVLQIMASRTGAIPYPPTFSGTVGLAFEIIGLYTKKYYFSYRFATYPVVKNDTVRGVELLRKTISINLVVSGLLSGDAEVLQSGLTVLQGLKKPDSEISFFIGLAGYFLGSNEDYLKFFDYKTKKLFTTL